MVVHGSLLIKDEDLMNARGRRSNPGAEAQSDPLDEKISSTNSLAIALEGMSETTKSTRSSASTRPPPARITSSPATPSSPSPERITATAQARNCVPTSRTSRCRRDGNPPAEARSKRNRAARRDAQMLAVGGEISGTADQRLSFLGDLHAELATAAEPRDRPRGQSRREILCENKDRRGEVDRER